MGTALRDDALLNCDFQPVLSIDSSPTLLAGLLELPSYRVMSSEVAKRKQNHLLTMSPTSILRLTVRQTLRPQMLRASRPVAIRIQPFSQSTTRAYPRKDSQDKDSIDTEATEYSKSGTDDG